MTTQQLHAPTARQMSTDHEGPHPGLPDELTSAEAKLVYLFVSVRGTTTVDELGDALDLPKLTLLSILQTLAGNDFVARDGDVVSAA
jgi:hypothetical protein